MVVGGRELIDTLWNVNEVSSAVSKASSRINRYIMECKYTQTLGSLPANTGINRYIMECKSKTVLRTLRATW